MFSRLSRLYKQDVRIDVRVPSLRSQWREHILWPWQRAQRGFSERDLWSFDWYLADVLSKGIRQLAARVRALDQGL